MTDSWWNEYKTMQFVRPNLPCESLDHAHRLVRTWVREGTMPMRQGAGGVIEFEVGAVERLCKSQRSGKGGRPPRPINDTLRILAGRWIGQNGPPKHRARLEEYLMQVASDHDEPISEGTAERLAQEALDAHEAHNPVVKKK